MKLRKAIVISRERLLFLFIGLLLFSIGNQDSLFAQASKPRSPSSLYLRAPDTIPGTLPEMRDPSYWIARMKNPGKVIMNLKEIQERNKDYNQRMSDLSQFDNDFQKKVEKELGNRPGLLASVPDIKLKTAEELSAITKNMIEKEIKFLKRTTFGNILGIEYSAEEINAIEDELAYNKIGNQIKIQPGVTVADSRLRIIPAIRPEYVGNTTLSRWDMWNYDVVPIASPVLILHISKTGGFLFVLSEKGYGWLSSEEVAIGSEDKIDELLNTGDFVVCTGNRVPYYSDSNCTYVSGWFRMGDRLPVKENNQKVVQVPTRMTNGNLLVQDAWLKPDEDIHIGYLPYCSKNVVLQSFKLLDNLYDWTGAWFGRDHATTLRDIFGCFGFKLPSNGVLMSAYNDITNMVYLKEGKDAQYKAISRNEPFLTIQICSSGHSQLYLGNYKGVPIVFDTHGYSYTDKSGNELVIRRANIGTITFPDYFLKQDITFVELK